MFFEQCCQSLLNFSESHFRFRLLYGFVTVTELKIWNKHFVLKPEGSFQSFENKFFLKELPSKVVP